MRNRMSPAIGLDALDLEEVPPAPSSWGVLDGVAAAASRVLRRLGLETRDAPAEVGSYRLLRRLGQGGMGEVFAAEHKLLGRAAAVKIVQRELLAKGSARDKERMLRRFELEARAMAGLTSAHTVTVHDYGRTSDGRFYYAMELLRGLDLETLVQESGPLPASRAAFLLEQACESLAEAHEQGMVHRDVKPANLYACRLGLAHDFVKVLDFGLVTRAEGCPSGECLKLTGRSYIVGTPAFIAPEVAAERTVDARADVYALGCVAYWLLTGRRVFERDSAVETIADHLNTPVVPPSVHAPGLPASLEAVVLACLEKDPANRPRDARALLARLEATGLARVWTATDARDWWEHRDGPARVARPSITTEWAPRRKERVA